MIPLIRDLLDVQVRDCRYRYCGRVDGLVMELQDGRAPRVTAVEMGGATLAKRLHPRVRRWYQWLADRVGIRAQPIRLSVADIDDIDLNLTLRIDAKSHPELLSAERWLTERIRGKAP